ncbi:hypothetical protein [Acetobacterium sp.]|uniref:hypothetical protein n=1 Tax=Acetobacterium sp. TaxID=1872094 RepID=UPI002F3EC6E9
MNILIIKLSPVEGLSSSMIRTLALTKGLLTLGHHVDFLTIPISECHVIGKCYDFLENVRIIRTKENTRYDSITSKKDKSKNVKIGIENILRKTYHKFSLYDYTYSMAKRVDINLLKTKYYDVVISSSDPKTAHIAAKQLFEQGLKYKKWIQYWGDPMALDITNKSIYPQWVIKKVENDLLKSADKIIYVSPFTLKKQKKAFPKLAQKMIFLPTPYIQEKLYDETQNMKFTIGYFGAYTNRVRNIFPLYKAGKLMKDSIIVNIVGNSDIVLEETDNIKVYPRGDISRFEREADLLVCMLNRGGTQIPGKVYHYAATNKPILILLDGDNMNEIREYLESFNRYIICNNEAESIVNAINNIKNYPKTALPCNEFKPEKIAEAFIS